MAKVENVQFHTLKTEESKEFVNSSTSSSNKKFRRFVKSEESEESRSTEDFDRRCNLRELSYLFSGTYSKLSTSNEGMYGEIKSNCLYKICQEMIKYGMDESSVLLDLGSGRGVPNVFFSSIGGTFSSIGIEKCSTAYMVSLQTIVDLLNRDLDHFTTHSNQSTPNRTNSNRLMKPRFIVRKSKGMNSDISLDGRLIPDADKLNVSGRKKREKDDYSTISPEMRPFSYFEREFDPDDREDESRYSSTRLNDSCENSLHNDLYRDKTDSANEKTPNRVYSSDKTKFSEYLRENDPEISSFSAPSRTTVEDIQTPKPRRNAKSDEMDKITSRHGVGFINEDISTFDNFDGVTHFYSFDAAMEGALINNIVYQFQNTKTAWVYCSFHDDLISKYELKDCFISGRIPCRMYVSNEHRNCYIYVKNNWKEIKNYSLEFLSSHFFSLRNKSKNGDLNIRDTVYTGSFNVNDWNEPSSALDMIRLTKCPLSVQYEWYRSKLDRINSTRITRSKSDLVWNTTKRNSLSAERDGLLENLAKTPSRDEQLKYRGELVRHINKHYSGSRSFPDQ